MGVRYEYEIVRHGERSTTKGRSSGNGYEDIITDHAAKGWRLVTIIPVSWRQATILPISTFGPFQLGKASVLDLVFEKRINKGAE
jgi:hypothetical protein